MPQSALPTQITAPPTAPPTAVPFKEAPASIAEAAPPPIQSPVITGFEKKMSGELEKLTKIYPKKVMDGLFAGLEKVQNRGIHGGQLAHLSPAARDHDRELGAVGPGLEKTSGNHCLRWPGGVR